MIVIDRRKLRTPIVVAVALVGFLIWRGDWLGLVGLPLIYLGWCWAAPNLNLIDGCLPILTSAVAITFWATVASNGLTAAGAAFGLTWIVASLETAWRRWPEASEA